VDDSRNSKTGGSGLGLSIAKKIAEAHGGDLTLCLNGNKGSTFRITVPTI
jgi:signal transduction histidine kinase